MELGKLIFTFFNNAGPGGLMVMLIFGVALTLYILLTRWIIAGGQTGGPAEDPSTKTDV